MTNPYLLDAPAVVSFSGGGTSGYMLWLILQAFGGKLPTGVVVIFCNTGKERPETLDFVERCAAEWGVEIVWLEYRRWQSDPGPAEGRWTCKPKGKARDYTGLERVNYATASRHGEPFEQIIAAKSLLPNVAIRYCTQWLKIKTSWRYARKVLGWSQYVNAIGLRADEPRRVARLRPASKSTTPGEEPIAPMARAGHTLADVEAFWRGQPFKLKLQPWEGNCDLCFLKGQGKLSQIVRDRPDLAGWWIDQEKRFAGKTRLFEAGRFRKNAPSYAATLAMAQSQQVFEFDCDNEIQECRCTD